MSADETRGGTAAEAAAVFASDNPLLWIITAAQGTRRGGLLAVFVMQASIVPDRPRVLIGIGKQHHTWALIRESGRFAAHLFGPEQTDWCWRFGLQSGFDRDKLEGLAVRQGALGAPILEDAAASLECRVEAEFDTGDRSLFLGEIVAAHRRPDRAALRAADLFAAASDDQRSRLAALYARDGRIDRDLIERWRSEHAEPRRHG